MKIVKLNDSEFYFETDEHEGVILNWKQLLTTFDDISDHLGDADIGELIAELASYGKGATKVL